MHIKKYLAVFMVLIFVVKIMAMDGKALVYIIGPTRTLVNPDCKKAKSFNEVTSPDKTSLSEKHSDSTISIGCLTTFDLKTYSWTQIISKNIFTPYNYLPTKHGILYKKSNDPPPRIL